MVEQDLICFTEDEVVDLYLLLVEKNDEILERMLGTQDLAEKLNYIQKSLKIHERMELIENKLGIAPED